MPLASISAPGVVTLIFVAAAVVIVAYFLLSIGMVLRRASAGLDQVISAVGQIPGRTDPVAPVLKAINADLGTARGVLEGLLVKKLGAVPQREGTLRHTRSVAQAETAPAAAPGAPAPVAAAAPARIVHQRAAAPAPPPPAPEPAAAAPPPETISYRRPAGPPLTQAAPEPEPEPAEPPAGMISYRRGAGGAPAAAAPAPAAAPEPAAPAPAAPAPAAAAAAPAAGSVSGEILQLAELHRQGVLSDEEFAAAKAAALR